MYDMDRPKPDPEQGRRVLEFWVTYIIRGWGSFGSVFIRSHYGTNYFEWTAPVACFVYFVYSCACFPLIAGEPWIVFGIAYLLMVIFHRLAACNSPDRFQRHSYSDGYSILSTRFKWKPMHAKKLGDPILVSLVGVGMMMVNWPFLAFFMWISACMGALDGLMYDQALRSRVRAMTDAQLEQDQILDQFDSNRY